MSSYLVNQLHSDCFDNLNMVETFVNCLIVIGLCLFLMQICILIVVNFHLLQERI